MNVLKAAGHAAVTSADVDQRRCGFHEGQLSVADETCGSRGQVHCQHHKIGLLQQLIQALTVRSSNCLLLFNAPEGDGTERSYPTARGSKVTKHRIELMCFGRDGFISPTQI